MTSTSTSRAEGQPFETTIDSDDNTSSDESLLLMFDNNEEKILLLNTIETNDDHDQPIRTTSHMLVDHIPLRARPSTLTNHCHRIEKPFDYAARNRLIIVLILCLIFMIIEIIGGIISNSTAIITDAAHMCVDATGFLISLSAMYLARKQPTNKLTFGYFRAEILGALLSVLTVWLTTGILVYMAIGRCIDQSFDVKPLEMIIVASCGVVFNIIMFFVLHAAPHHGHSHQHSHSHHHSHSEESLVVETVPGHGHSCSSSTNHNINIRSAVIHVIGDFFQSIGVLLAAILIKVKPQCKLADPICTFLFSVLVLITTFPITRDIISVLMEGVPSHLNPSSIFRDLQRLSGVRNVHSLHLWSLSTQTVALSVHLAIDVDRDQYQILNEAQELLEQDYQITRSTIQFEIYDEQTINNCVECHRQIDP